MDAKQNIEQIQKIEMEILKEFIEFCDSNQIKYFLVEGSLLGAIRHKGMIPWDDDIDVAMYRDDFERFLKIAPEGIHVPYVISNFKIQNTYVDYITQINDSRYSVRTSYRKKDDVVNVWIDVFVLDGMPRKRVQHFLHKYNLLFHKMLVMWSDLEHYLVTGRKNRPMYEKMLIWLCKKFHFERFIDTKEALEKMDQCMKKFKPVKDGNVINFMSEYKWKTEFPESYYGDGIIVPFGDLMVRIPVQSKKILESIYGNYMELPSEDERYKHHLVIVE